MTGICVRRECDIDMAVCMCVYVFKISKASGGYMMLVCI